MKRNPVPVSVNYVIHLLAEGALQGRSDLEKFIRESLLKNLRNITLLNQPVNTAKLNETIQNLMNEGA